MRKLITFLIVLIIQISIIYGLYRWYVSYDNNSLNTKSNADTSESRKVPEIPKDTPPAKQQTSDSNINKKVQQIKSADIPETFVKNDSTDKSESISNNPLIYKNTVWGNIPALERSRLAETGILVDIDNRNVLWAKHCRKSVPIASMTKMMTILLAFEAIGNKKISLDTVIPVTNEAYKIGGSQVYLDPREKFTLEELLKTVVISSANDSAYLIAQYLGNGDVNVFVREMNKRAKELHMRNAYFSNPDGLPAKYSKDDNRATAEDLVFLAEQLLKYPLVIQFATTRLDYFRKDTKKPMMLVNTNHLIRDKFPGITGMKTGYIKKSGFCLTATCERNGKRLIAVVTGFKNRKERDLFVKNLLNWGYNKINAKH